MNPYRVNGLSNQHELDWGTARRRQPWRNHESHSTLDRARNRRMQQICISSAMLGKPQLQYVVMPYYRSFSPDISADIPDIPPHSVYLSPAIIQYTPLSPEKLLHR